MSGYFDRGTSAGGSDEGYFNRADITGPAGVGSATGGPGGVADDDLEVDPDNPNIVRATPREPHLDETAGTTTQQRVEGTYPAIVEGSDSARTGTSWGVPGFADEPAVETVHGYLAEGEEPGKAAPNPNTADNRTKDELKNVGSWSTIDTDDTAGSPTGFS